MPNFVTAVTRRTLPCTTVLSMAGERNERTPEWCYYRINGETETARLKSRALHVNLLLKKREREKKEAIKVVWLTYIKEDFFLMIVLRNSVVLRSGRHSVLKTRSYFVAVTSQLFRCLFTERKGFNL